MSPHSGGLRAAKETAMVLYLRPILLAIALLSFGLAPVPAEAHPHVWVTVKSDLVFAPDGKVKAVRHAWTFDEMFSAYATQGLDKDGDGKLSREELAELAEVNVTSLEEFEYFSVGKSGEAGIAFGKPVDYWLEADKDNVLTLHFTLPLKTPADAREFSLAVYDPTFFVDLSFPEDVKVELVDAPVGCAADLERPKSFEATMSTLSESFFNTLTASSDFGAQFATRINLRCK
jgi:ABC-type uncharacterized transport system substrate-binding protein